ncbi:unnamed protein product, partial [Discosporangium mesarthrocarpum]
MSRGIYVNEGSKLLNLPPLPRVEKILRRARSTHGPPRLLVRRPLPLQHERPSCVGIEPGRISCSGGSGFTAVGRHRSKRERKRALGRALSKVMDVASRCDRDNLQGLKAFEGPPLTPADVKDLLLRNFRVHLTEHEAAELIDHFSKDPGGGCIEHRQFLVAFVKLTTEVKSSQA